MERQYEFHVTLCGYGETKDQAWLNACEALAIEPGEPPENADTVTREPGDLFVE